MALEIRPYGEDDLAGMIKVWNEVVESGKAFPQIDRLTVDSAREFFAQQTLSIVAHLDGKIFGLYILHPNNIGRCAHIANASYAVVSGSRGVGLGRALVEDSLVRAAKRGFRGMQFNAVVESNDSAIHLYESMGFARVGTIPEGFINFIGGFEDVHLYYRSCVGEASTECTL